MTICRLAPRAFGGERLASSAASVGAREAAPGAVPEAASALPADRYSVAAAIIPDPRQLIWCLRSARSSPMTSIAI